MSAPDRREMLDRADEKLSILRQSALFSLARSGVHRPKKPANSVKWVLRIACLNSAANCNT